MFWYEQHHMDYIYGSDICVMEESTSDNKSLINSIEKVLISLGGHKEYHAKILASAIFNVLSEKGLIKNTSDSENQN